MKITGNTIKAKIKSLSGVSAKMVSSDGGNHFTVYLENRADNFKVAYAIHRAGWKRTANNESNICIEV